MIIYISSSILLLLTISSGTSSLQQPTQRQRLAHLAPHSFRGVAIPVAAPLPLQLTQLTQSTGRLVRTASAQFDELDFVVTNVCERNFTRVSLQTSQPFYGAIHSKNQRHKSLCSFEASGQTEVSLNLPLVLNQNSSNYCGAFKLRRRGQQEQDSEGQQLVAIILAVRLHRNIELSNDKFFLLNCTK